jgi:hypothetical protein
MEVNPYQSPGDKNPLPAAACEWRRPWFAWVAFGWVVLFCLAGPLVEPAPADVAGKYLWLKILTTTISTIAGIVLIWIPRRWWKLLTIPLVGFLVFLQVGWWLYLA